MLVLQVYLIYQKSFWMSVFLFLHFFIKLIYPFLEILSKIFSCSENVQFDLFRMHPEFFYIQNMFDLHVQIPDMKKFWISYLIIFLRHFPNIFKYIRIDSGHFDDIFLTFLFYRAISPFSILYLKSHLNTSLFNIQELFYNPNFILE